MRKLKQRLALTAAALAFTPPTILRLVSTNNNAAIGISALAAMLAGFVLVMAAVQMLENKKW